MREFSRSTFFFIAFTAILFLLAVSAYLEMYANIQPCPLCMVQRVLFGLFGLFCIAGMLWEQRFYQRFIGSSGLLISILGLILSSRQVWLQHVPSQLGSNCDLSLRYMLQILPLNEVIERVFIGGSSCSQVGWTLLHISLAEWALIGFILLCFFSVRLLRFKTSSS